MARILFKTEQALIVFHSMAEGMHDNKRDDNVSPTGKPSADMEYIAGIIEQTGFESEGATYPRDVALPFYVLPMARSILENCLSDSEGEDPQGEHAADYVFPGDVSIIYDGETSMETQAALLMAIEFIERSGIAESDHSAEAVLKHLDAMVAQKGCEGFDPTIRDGLLTTLCDLVIYG